MCNQAHILVEGYCKSQGTDILVNDFSAFLSMKRYKKLGFIKFSPENNYHLFLALSSHSKQWSTAFGLS